MSAISITLTDLRKVKIMEEVLPDKKMWADWIEREAGRRMERGWLPCLDWPFLEFLVGNEIDYLSTISSESVPGNVIPLEGSSTASPHYADRTTRYLAKVRRVAEARIGSERLNAYVVRTREAWDAYVTAESAGVENTLYWGAVGPMDGHHVGLDDDRWGHVDNENDGENGVDESINNMMEVDVKLGATSNKQPNRTPRSSRSRYGKGSMRAVTLPSKGVIAKDATEKDIPKLGSPTLATAPLMAESSKHIEYRCESGYSSEVDEDRSKVVDLNIDLE